MDVGGENGWWCATAGGGCGEGAAWVYGEGREELAPGDQGPRAPLTACSLWLITASMPSAVSRLARRCMFSVPSAAARASEMRKKPSSTVYWQCEVCVFWSALQGPVRLQPCMACLQGTVVAGPVGVGGGLGAKMLLEHDGQRMVSVEQTPLGD